MRVLAAALAIGLASPALAQNGVALDPVEVPASRGKVRQARPAARPADENATAAARQDDLDARLARQASHALRSVCRGCDRTRVERMPPEDDLPPLDPAEATPVE